VHDLDRQANTAPLQSASQKKLILRMADAASNGKELMLTKHAASGVLASPSGDDIHSVVTAKMMILERQDAPQEVIHRSTETCPPARRVACLRRPSR
jgi:hypothetical protein